ALKSIGQVAGDHRRDHHGSGDQGNPENLGRGQYRNCEQGNEDQIDFTRRNAVGGSDFRIEGREQELPAQHDEHGRDNQGNNQDDPEIFLSDAQNVAEERGFDVASKASIRGNDGAAGGERGSSNDTDGGGAGGPTAWGDQGNEQTGEERP